MGACGVSYPQGRVQANQVAISDDRFLPGLKRMTDAVHGNGGRISAQLHHGGISSVYDILADVPLLCPSLPLPTAAGGAAIFGMLFPGEMDWPSSEVVHVPRLKEMDNHDIARLAGDFADAAARAVAAGFDAVELHAGHSYIISSFLSPAENRRTDGYGGSVENRARLMKEIIEAIRQRIGRSFPMLCKMNAAEFYIDGGLTLDDVRSTARIAEAAGVDAITVTTTHNYAVAKALFSSYLPHEPGKLIPYAAAVKEAVSLPVVTVGRIDPDVADRAIGDGKFDFMAMGRKQIADPGFARHLAEGGPKAVRPCIYDYACLSQSMLQKPVRCAANPDAGYENRDLLHPTESSRRVVVVGGGPGGMEAARRLSLRGHSVTLLEADDRLGGAARLAAIAYEPNDHLLEWLQDQLMALRVEIRLNTRATVQTVRSMNPDAVIVATGARHQTPAIDGHSLLHVHGGGSLSALLLRDDRSRAGDHIVVIGSDLIALELADFAHKRGATVAVVDDVVQFGWGLSPARRSVLLAEMAESDISLHSGAVALHIEPDAVCFTDGGGNHMRLRADTVAIVKGASSDPALFRDLTAAGLEAHLVGDCAEVGYIRGALRTAADVAALV